MRTGSIVLGSLLSVLLACAGPAPLPAQETGKAGSAAPMDQKAAMELMLKYATPGEGHRKLDPMVGSWTAKGSIWMDPSQPPQQVEGTSEVRWVLGGRFLEHRYEAAFMGMPHSGLGYTGYDNYKKKYISIWMDTFGTMMLHTTGSYDPATSSLSSTGTMDDVMRGGVSTIRDRTTMKGKDEMVMEMWGPGPDGKEFKSMEMRFTRKK